MMLIVVPPLLGGYHETVRSSRCPMHRANYRVLAFSRLAGLREGCDELRPGVDVELAVDLAEVELDRLGRQEQVGRDVAVGRAALYRGGHAQLLPRERVVVPL